MPSRRCSGCFSSTSPPGTTRKRLPTERIVPHPAEKAEFLRLGSEFGHDDRPVLEIVKPATYRRWINDAKRDKQPKKSVRRIPVKKGILPTPEKKQDRQNC